jgi:hypothetical protein
MQKLIIITSDDGSREAGSIYYSTFLLVESDTLKFDEEIFFDYSHGSDGILDEDSFFEDKLNHVRNSIISLGYTVVEPDEKIIEID